MNLTKPRGTVRVAYRRMWNPSISGIEGRDGIARQRLRRASSNWILPLLLLLILPVLLQAQFNYTVENGTVTITKYTGPGGDVIISDTIDGLPVTIIGNWAFWLCSNLTSITIPDSVTRIGSAAFHGCISLTSITIPDSVNSIEGEAFFGCTALTSITIPDKVTTIEGGAFSGCISLTSVTIPNSVTCIGNLAFSRCTGLTSVTIPDSVTDIGRGAFSGCTGVTSVTIGNSVTRIGDSAFSGCTGLTSVTIPDSVTSIEWGAFSYCTGLTGAYFEGDSPYSDSAFESCPAVIVFYRAGTSDWGPTFDGRPTALWIPITLSLHSYVSNNVFKLATHSPAPTTVRVQRSVNLLDWEDWQTVLRDAGPSELQDSGAGTAPWRFYRGIEE